MGGVVAQVRQAQLARGKVLADARIEAA